MDRETKKIIIILLTTTICVCALILLTLKFIFRNSSFNDDKLVNKVNGFTTSNMKNQVNNFIADKNTIDKVNNTVEVNNVVETNKTENKTQSNKTNTNNIVVDKKQETTKEELKTEEENKEKAIQIAKKDWGADNTVYFSLEGVENGNYIVCVREVSNTRAIKIYTINVKTGTFTVE